MCCSIYHYHFAGLCGAFLQVKIESLVLACCHDLSDCFFFYISLIFLMPSRVEVILTQFIFLAIHVNMFGPFLVILNPCLVVWARTTLSQV